MGLAGQEIAQPSVGVVTTWNEAAPCNTTLSRQTQAAKRGVTAAVGTPREFTPFFNASLGLIDHAKALGFDIIEICVEDPSLKR
jgi:hypothetical protein